MTTTNIAYVTATPDPTIFRLGMTNEGRSPYVRWSEDADYRKIDYKMADQVHEFYELGNHSDHEIFKVLLKDPNIERLGVRSGEIFKCTQGWEYFNNVAQNAIAITTGKAWAVRKSLDSRPYQTRFVQQFLNTTGDFCLFAKCRSGKSAMTLMAATEANYKSALIVSYRTSAANSWRDDVVTYTQFQEWDVIDLGVVGWEKLIQVSQVAGRRQLLVSTVQRQSERFSYLDKLIKCYPQGVDLLALDECHIGGESAQFNKLCDRLGYGRLLEISGTAYRTIWSYPRENVFVWGYVEEQRAKAEGYDWAQKLPKLELILARYNANNLAKVYGEDPDALKNVFSVSKGDESFVDSASVQGFLRQFFAYGSQTHKKQQMLRSSQHIVMTLPSVAACHLFAKQLEIFGSQFVPLVITGESGNGQQEILQHVTKHPNTICLTRWANVVGVTIPQWDTVIHGCEYESAEFWVQFTFRGGSTPLPAWKVIDFAPERALSSIIEMCTVTATVSDEDSENLLRSFLEFADVYDFTDGYTILDYETVLDGVDVGVETARAHTNGIISSTRIGDKFEAIAWAFSDQEKLSNLVQVSESVNTNGLNGKGNVQTQRGINQGSDSDKILKETLARVKNAVSRIDDVVMVGLLKGDNLNTLPKLLRAEYFERQTKCHPDIFEMAIDCGWIDEKITATAVGNIHLALDRQFSALA